MGRENIEKQNSDVGTKAMPIVVRGMQRIRNRLLHNFGWKVLSLISAFIVWMSIMNIQDPYVEMTLRNVPVTVLNEAALQEQGKISDIEVGRTVDFTIKAPRSVADNLTASDFAVTADYRQMSLVYAVPIQIRVSEESEYAGEDVTIESKSPEMMQLTLEDYVQEPFRVDVNTTGEVAEGYFASDILVKPTLVQIAGAQKQIERIARVVVDLDITGADRTFTKQASLSAYDKNGYLIEEKLLDFEVSEVDIEVTVLPVKKIPLYVNPEGNPGYGYACVEIQYLPSEITISGTEEDLREMKALNIPFNISMQVENVEKKINLESYLEEYYEGRYKLVDEEKYVTVKAYIEKMPSMNIRVNSYDIEVRGLAEPYGIRYTNKNDINIKVLGPQEILDTLTVKDLRMYIDVTDFEPGSYYVSVYSDTQLNVTVRIGTIGIEILETKDTFAPDNTTGSDEQESIEEPVPGNSEEISDENRTEETGE